jgi:hypothetical protein
MESRDREREREKKSSPYKKKKPTKVLRLFLSEQECGNV